ncbi:helix-turn-helix transcriptional regulator [Amnibacterium sp.]|uniref:helix-turn-helix transcriptional regulator n=1 Tax=Amnibacterium sp. TaxID=1872496 RepID=UPI002637D9B0|nr:helix-turn-helix transcriptional regulator [Amnibacterium sp.]MCU1472083.1 hypothetical protein [Amnibacterium sp.]
MDTAASGAPVSPVLVGRARERAAIAATLESARNAETGLVLLSGEAGVGKTRLVDEAARLAEGAGMRVLSGHCVQLGAEGLPFAPLVEALRDLTRSTSPERLADLLGPARRLLPRLLPGLDQPAEAPPAEGSQLLELVLGLLVRLAADQPLLVVLEDLHWADRSTLDLAAYLVQALRAAPIALLYTYRSDELHRRHPLRPLVLGWDRMRAVRHLELDRFDLDDVRTQIAAILGTEPEPRVLETIFARSEGNAFLVEELVGVVQAGGDPDGLPPNLRDLLLARVDALGDEAQRMLRHAAVAGPEVDEPLLLAAAEASPETGLAALREAVDAHLLVVAGPGYRFRHALVRDAVYDDLLPGERGRIHAAFGAAIEAQPGLVQDSTTRAAAAAHHWFAALDLPRALVASVEAARLSVGGLAPAEGLTHYERALQLWPRVPDAADLAGADRADVLLAAADAAHQSGAVDRALALLALVPEELGDGTQERRAAVLHRRARVLRDLGRIPDAIEICTEALALLPAAPATELQAAILGALANLHMRSSAPEQAREVGRLAVEAARAAGARAEEADARLTVGVATTWLGEFDDALDELRAAIGLAQEAGAVFTTLRGAINLSHVLEMQGRSAEAAAVADEGMAVAERSGLVRTLGDYLAGNLAESLLHVGEWARAEQVIERALRTRPEGIYAATLSDVGAQLAALSGRWADAARRLRDATAMVGDIDDEQFAQPLACTAAMLLEHDGDPAGAVERLLAAAIDEPWSSPYAWPLLWLAARIDADRVLAGGPGEERIPPLVARIGDATPPQRAYLHLATAEQARAEGSATRDTWHRVATSWAELGWPYPHAYSLYRAGEAALSEGQPESAAADLEEAAGEAARIGAAPLADSIAALVSTAGLPLPGRGTAASAVERRLTTRELEVLRLVAAGRSNPQIAAALFISPKTASVHVSNILAKLEVGTRTEAAGLAQRVGLLTAD